jgi:hypothetical protein
MYSSAPDPQIPNIMPTEQSATLRGLGCFSFHSVLGVLSTPGREGGEEARTGQKRCPCLLTRPILGPRLRHADQPVRGLGL